MYVHQTIQRPFGINVFGSCVVRVKPDLASIAYAVTRTADKPAEAFAAAHRAGDEIRGFLGRADVAAADVQSSLTTLRQSWRGAGDKLEMIGFQARTDFVVQLRDLGRLEHVLTGIVESGADVIDGVTLRTSKLAELRADARLRALQAARRKAEAYARAADITLGPIVHIEDIDPDEQRARRGHAADLDLTDDELAAQPHDPGSIDVTAAVMVGFQIDRDKPLRSGF